MRIIVCGGRQYADVIHVWRTLDQIDQDYGGVRCVIDGASDDVTGPYVGADFWGHQWALAHNLPTERFHAEWKTQGRAAGPIRNQRMLNEGRPDMVIAFPGGNGTRNMIALAEKAGVGVVRP